MSDSPQQSKTHSTPIPGWLVFAAWAMTAVLAYFGPGRMFAERVEGMDHSQIPLLPSVTFLIVGAIAFVLTALWAYRLRPKPGAPENSARRRFLAGSAAVTGGAIGAGAGALGATAGWITVTNRAFQGPIEKTAATPRDIWTGSRIQSYRPLGNTGFNVSDISFGATKFLNHADPHRLLREAFERGINYVDTSPDYGKERSEQVIGEVVKDLKRDELFLASKFCTSAGHLRQGSSVADYMAAVEGSLTRMQVDHLDLVHIHACDSIERLMDPNVHEAFDRLKDQGKVRFLGVSTHTPNLEEVATAALDSNRFEVLMLAYHHGAWPLQREIIDRAANQGVGVIAMKTLMGARHRGLMELDAREGDAYSQAAFKWVLDNPAVSGLVISFSESQHLDEYLFASGKRINQADVALLDKYRELVAGTHCFQHCGDCQSTCPENLPIHDVLRHRMYFEDYGDQKTAMSLYAQLPVQADVCLTCSAPCTNACPQGIDIATRTREAHEMLTFG